MGNGNHGANHSFKGGMSKVFLALEECWSPSLHFLSTFATFIPIQVWNGSGLGGLAKRGEVQTDLFLFAIAMLAAAKCERSAREAAADDRSRKIESKHDVKGSYFISIKS